MCNSFHYILVANLKLSVKSNDSEFIVCIDVSGLSVERFPWVCARFYVILPMG